MEKTKKRRNRKKLAKNVERGSEKSRLIRD